MVRGPRRTILIAAVAAAVLAAPAATRSSQVLFLTKPAGASQGSAVRATVVLSRAVPSCSGSLRHARTAVTSVAEVVRQRAFFSWQLPASASPGLWTIAVTCGPAGSAKTSFRVTRRAPPTAPPAVTVEKTGFSAGGGQVGYGIVLRNAAADRDAIGVTLTVKVLDAGGSVLKSEVSRIPGIPATTTSYFGSVVPLDAGTTAASVQANVTVEAGQARRSLQPLPVSGVHAVDAGGIVHIQGVVSNQTARPVSTLTRISTVVFDPAGNVIGGGFTFPTETIQPNDDGPFDIAVPGVTIDRVGSAQVSAG
jgi:hypothetical protein